MNEILYQTNIIHCLFQIANFQNFHHIKLLDFTERFGRPQTTSDPDGCSLHI